MRYTVVWRPAAQNDLAELWLASTDRATMTRAAHQVDIQLQSSPETKGVEFYGDRLLVVPPLQLIFTVRLHDRIVDIQSVW